MATRNQARHNEFRNSPLRKQAKQAAIHILTGMTHLLTDAPWWTSQNGRTLMGKMMEQIHQLGIPMGCTTFREALMIYQKTHMENQFDKVEPSSQKVGQERCSGRTRASMDSGSLWRHGLQILCTSQGYLMALGTKVPLWLCHQLILRMCCPLQVAAHLPVMSNTFIVHWVLLQPLLKFQSDCLKWLP